MLKIALLILMTLPAMLLSSRAQAEWTKVFSGFNPTAYADLDTLKRTGDVATMSVLVDFKKVPFDGNNLPYLSLKMKIEYHCQKAEFRFLELASYAGHMATGRSPYVAHEPSQWQPTTDHGIQKSLWDVACK